MSNQRYPGLVQVPPSDRWIFRRRLLRWSFAIIAVVWGASAITAWLPPPDKNTDCQTGIGYGASPNIEEKCGQPGQSVATAPSAPPQSESLVTEVSPKASPAESHSPKPMPALNIDRPATQPSTDAKYSPAPVAKRPDTDRPATHPSTDPKYSPAPVANRLSTDRPTGQPSTDPKYSQAPVANRLSTDRPTTQPSTDPKYSQAPVAKRLDTDRPATQPSTDRASIAKPSSPVSDSAVPTVAPLRENTSATSQEAKAPPSSPNPDIRLAEKGNAFAQYRLGRFYAQQRGPQAPESLHWYRKASDGLRRLAEAGNGQAMYVIGVMYAFGRGVKKDRDEAQRWLTQAVEHKVAAARQVLASLERRRKADPDPQAFVSH